MKKLYLVDVSSMFFRAFYALPPLRSSKGLPTSALYGFLSMSIKLLRESRPDYMVYCFDRKEPSFRAELYDEYKANRTEMPEDLEPQIPYVRRLTEELGILAIDKKGYEADDVIGSLAVFGAKHGCDVSIVSGDKDFAQLVNDRIVLYDTMKDIRYGVDGVVEKWGVHPDQMIDYLAIVGDSSDNIPGVRGVGPKGAQKLLAEFKTLEGIYENLEKIPSESLKTKLKESKKSAFLAKKLVSIVTDLDFGVELDNLKMKPIDKDRIGALFAELEFEAFARKLFDEGADGTMAPKALASKTARPYASGQKSSSKSAMSKSAAKDAADTIVKSLKSPRAQVSAEVKPWAKEQWSLEQLKKKVPPYSEVWAVLNERGFCLGHGEKAVQIDGSLEEIGHILGGKMLQWKGFDLKRLWKSLKLEQAVTPAWDTMLAAYVDRAGDTDEFPGVYEKYCAKKVPDLAAPEDCLHCEREVELVLRARLEETRGMQVLNDLELPIVPVLYDMEQRGVYIDRSILQTQSRALATDIAGLEKSIFKQAGESFNIASPKQLGHILFERLKIPSAKKNKTGYSTDVDVLTRLAREYEICKDILSYRELTKLKSTYVDALPLLIDAGDGRVHTNYQQALTATGRLSSINPNLQNIPIRSERGRAIRKAFSAPEGSMLLSVDYSQIELRVLAEITGDQGLVTAFRNQLDIHAATASEVFGVPMKEVTLEQRRLAKAVNFGIAYGQGPFGLAESLEISRDEAKAIIDNYFSKFRKVKDYMMSIVTTAQEQGYVETTFGRRRYIDEFKSSNPAVRKFGERAAINAPIQGTASDIMKKAMIDVHASASAKMILQVHDELVFECSADEVESQGQQVRKLMESAVNWSVPLRVNVAWGSNWEDAHA
jgi:DNA polymerase-1